MDFDKVNSGRSNLRSTISGWYYALRNLAIVALLSILVYVAIRMILTSISQDKAKYKMMFKDWLVALCLVFIMHYIMVGILNISTTITQAIGTSGESFTNGLESSIIQKLDEAGVLLEGAGTSATLEKQSMNITKEAGAETILYAATVIMNIIFLAKYIIRAIILIFLTILAPITAITYPIDKISDGKSQAFDMWLKEYLYNVIIQPFHLLIYVVLIGSAAELASNNLIYAMLCFGVMIPAEKFIKQMFGFKDNLGSPLGAFAAGAVGSNLLNKMKSGGSKVESKPNSSESSSLPTNNKSVDTPSLRDNSPNPDDGNNPNPDDGNNPNPDDGNNPNPDNGNNQNPDDGNNPNPDDGNNPNPDDGNNPNPDDGNNPNPDDDNNPNPDDGNNPNLGDDNNSEPRDTAGKRIESAWKSRRNEANLKKYGTSKYGIMDAGKAIKNEKGFKKITGASSALYNGKVGKIAKRGVSKAYSGAKNAGRKAIKGATTLAGAAALGAFGAMFGQGKAGMAAGAALGNKVGGGITKVTDGVSGEIEGYVKDMHNAAWNKSEKLKKENFRKNENNIKLATQNCEDRYGKTPDADQIMSELDKMYELKKHGIKEEQYNDTLKQYEKYKNANMDEKDAKGFAMLSALEAQKNSPKDFRDGKTMKQAGDSLYRQLYEGQVNSGDMSRETANKNVKLILQGGAEMHGVEKPNFEQL